MTRAEEDRARSEEYARELVASWPPPTLEECALMQQLLGPAVRQWAAKRQVRGTPPASQR